MILFPNCKINLGLHITRKREDGYHDLETIFYPLAWQDALECIQGAGGDEAVSLTTSGIPVSAAPEQNLCVKAWHLLKKDFPQIGPVRMHLHKNIPMGAGLGGGSSDGAFALRLLNDFFQLPLSTDQLLDYALRLGSDCPFFILNRPCHATGRGEKLQPLALDLSVYRFVLVHPGIHVSTAAAFSGIQPRQPEQSLATLINSPVDRWKQLLTNDFEATVCALHPEIAAIKKTLYEAGAVYASMSGSGSAVYGLFNRNHQPLPAFPAGYTTYTTG
ncbi:4-(cytidine 5'-diphospho)-2-C-methyl-D-erythritol kinase [Sediminibacterium soli]|uniref:4-(cytidine 5'-diphospho)-2-C-methyl-D-erythritol kinase n=1 Tax=Sediminibacterium soli TaxID=2698829 RepID=UPI00137947FD|nr:4-(cytidine 5'-diphospho)-2-C-methyl-D-erythritol kinase [Sediminibacterium soli]NCI45947.1 4-(cytidine 5'-diphospho)-2-C-methyl-D-erythritol kinase [Sediminibacterium soli]